MECTKLNCPMQAGTVTENCGDNCPWRTTEKGADLISRAAAIDALKRAAYWQDGERKIAELPAVDAVPVAWLKKWCDSYDYNLFYSIPLKQVLKSWEIEKHLQNERRNSE